MRDHRTIGSVRDAIRRTAIGDARWALAALAVILLVAASLVVRPRPLLVWNVSASAPVGLYFVAHKARLAPGDMVAARLPRSYRMFAARRHYLPINVPLIKRVAGAPGDRVCAAGASVQVNGRWAATRLAVDARQRSMPWWWGCVRLAEGEYFLVMSNSHGSFDGRYFGISSAEDIIGKAVLLWRG